MYREISIVLAVALMSVASAGFAAGDAVRGRQL
jgi:hypothetical protein